MNNVLELAGRIDQPVFNAIEAVRDRRNKVVHSADVVKRIGDRLKKNPKPKSRLVILPKNCDTAFAVIEHFVKQVLDVDLCLIGKTHP